MIKKHKKFDFTIIGAGPMGMYLSYLLSNRGSKVRLLDGNREAGGHAKPINFCGVKIEIFYHFFYKNDAIRSLKWINSVKGRNKIIWKKIKTEIIYRDKKKRYFINPDKMYEVFNFIKFEFVKLIIGLLRIKFSKKNSHLTLQKANQWAKLNFGKKFSLLVWRPLLKGKFGKKWNKISALWLYSRIKTHLSTKNFIDKKSLFGYLCSTYETTINKTLRYLNKSNSIFIPNSIIKDVVIEKNKITKLKLDNKNIDIDANEKVISTIPLFALKKILKNKKEFRYLKKFEGISVIVCILKIKKKLSDCYWTSISDNNCPFNAIIQQNRLFPKSNFEIVYTSKYIESDSAFFKMDKKKISNKTIKSIMSIYSHISKKDIQKIIVFKSISAAPIPTINTINNVPNFKSPLENFWHGGLEYVYPEDRGLSNSIEISEKLFSEVK
tara:strand:+ start:586 stop:1899 length:1314 start_codon:yes stop_codon:yes gene_type:complete